MAKKNFILLSMEDEKIKKVSNVISNDSCRKILDYLAEKEATESELSEKLGIPISTVHYNLQQLMDTGLVSADEFHYSEKGKEVNHYRLANKYIIIAPKNTRGIKDKLKSILPVALIVTAAAGVVQFVSRYFQPRQAMPFAMEKASPQMMQIADEVAQDAAISAGAEATRSMAVPLAQNATESLNETVYEAVQESVQDTVQESMREIAREAAMQNPLWQNIALWFFAGAVFALLVYFIVSIIRKDID